MDDPAIAYKIVLTLRVSSLQLRPEPRNCSSAGSISGINSLLLMKFRTDNKNEVEVSKGLIPESRAVDT